MHPIPIVIVNYKDYARRYLRECVASIRAVTDTPWKLYVVDNATSAETRAYISAEAPEAVIIPFEENLGYSVYTRVAKQLRAEGYRYMLVMNMDVEVDPGFLAPLVSVADSDEQIAAVQSRIMLYGKEGVVNSAGNTFHYLGFGYSVGGYGTWEDMKRAYAGHPQITYPSGACMLVRLDAVGRIGLFDEDFFMYHEDLDFGWKALLAGYRCHLVPESVIYHKYEFARSTSQYYWMERNRFICLFKNYRVATLLLLWPILVTVELGLLLFAFVRGFGAEKIRVYAQWFSPAYWRRIRDGRAHIKSIRRAGDHVILERATGSIDAQQTDNVIVRYLMNPLCRLWLALLRAVVVW